MLSVPVKCGDEWQTVDRKFMEGRNFLHDPMHCPDISPRAASFSVVILCSSVQIWT